MTAHSRRYGRWCRDHFGTEPGNEPARPDPAGGSAAPQPAADASPLTPDSPEERKPPGS
ncbi:MAG: hypothetical protein ACRD0H_18025 [Actinomycetes bacterium]